MTLQWYPIAEAVQRVFTGEIVNALAAGGILAAYAVATGFAEPRPVDSPWTDKPTAFSGATGRRMTTLAPPLEGQLQGYLDHLTIERGVAANTLELLSP